MVLHQIVVQHHGSSHHLEFDSDDGIEVLQIQLFSLTLVPPERQKVLDNSGKPLTDESDLSRLGNASQCTLTLLEEKEESNPLPCTSAEDRATVEKTDEELARLLQAEEEVFFLQQQSGQQGRQEFASRIESYINQVKQYEEPSRQEAARRTVHLQELEEKAAIALAKEGKRSPSQVETEHAFLYQLLLWFKRSFRWVDAPSCTLCGAKTDAIGMGTPNSEELRYGANRVELYRCRLCQTATRFPRYNDTLKLIETRSGRCGEWANCFTLYCRAFGYQARLVLDFTDHVWTECFSKFLDRWVHLDPCEGEFDKPLLYEQGWGKKLNYMIALSKDGVFDVTKRYTKDWDKVRVRRNITSEENVRDVVASLTAKIRSNLEREDLRWLEARDKKEADELLRSQKEHGGKQVVLPGRQSGTEGWRMARGEMGSSSLLAPEKPACPKRLCVDKHVRNIYEALGALKNVCEDDRMRLDSILKAIYGLLCKLKEAPFKTRHIQVTLKSDASLLSGALDGETLKKLLQALGLIQSETNHGEFSIFSDDAVETALALPVILEKLEILVGASKTSTGFEMVLKRINFLAENERLCDGWTQASGEGSTVAFATSAFDGLQSTKWEEPNGAKGCWISYYLPDGATAQVDVYELTSANDCPQRDPKDWVLEGSHDKGRTWTILDEQNSQLFRRRFEMRAFKIPKENIMACNALRFKFLSIQDSSSESRLQLSCIDFFKRKVRQCDSCSDQ